jgi:hypothetical protein
MRSRSVYVSSDIPTDCYHFIQREWFHDELISPEKKKNKTYLTLVQSARYFWPTSIRFGIQHPVGVAPLHVGKTEEWTHILTLFQSKRAIWWQFNVVSSKKKYLSSCKLPDILSGFNQIWIFSTDSHKSVCPVGATVITSIVRHDKRNSSFSRQRERA